MTSGDETPIYDELVQEYQEHPPRTEPFQHAGGILCQGCRFCLAQTRVNDSIEDWAGWFPRKVGS